MWINTPNEHPENNQTFAPEAPKMPNDHPEKQWLFAKISDALRNLSKLLGFNVQNENGEKKVNKFQAFLASMIGIFNGIDIKKGITIENPNDISKIREAFRPIINLDETGIVFEAGDFIIFNEDTGTVDFYPADKNNTSGHSTEMSGTVVAAPRKIPAKTPEQVEAEYESKVNNHTIIPQETNETKTTALAGQLGRWLVNHGPARTGNNSCGKAVHALLDKFGIKNVGQKPRHGNKWHSFLENDPRFKKIEVNSLADIPSGAIMTYSGKWRLNGKANGSAMNQKYGHVEIKWNNKLFYSFNGANNPGGSAREPQLHNNFVKWKEATGFTWAFVPIAKTKEEARRIRNSSTFDTQYAQKPQENRNFNEKEFIDSQLKILHKKGLKSHETAIIVSSQSQKTYLVRTDGTIVKSYISSTAKNGLGNQAGSFKTPAGTLKIEQKIGANAEKMTKFEGLQAVGKSTLATKDTKNDDITSRVLTLSGVDKENSNTLSRNIYFHGTNEEFLLGKAASNGCIRMKNDDIIEMFDLVKPGTLVQIA